MMTLPTEEWLDLVNEKDEVIGKMLRAEVRVHGLKNIRASTAFIKNSKGQLWIPRRVASKASSPLKLDGSVMGLVMSGETYDEAFARETMEETGIDINKVSWRRLGKMTPHQHGTACFQTCYEILSDATPNYNPDDFCEYFWLTPAEILERLQKGDKSKSDLPKIIKFIYGV